MVARSIFILCAINFSGCGNIPCTESFNMYVGGLCIQTNGFIVNRINLNNSIGITENKFNQFHKDNPVNLKQLFIENNITLTFVDELDGKYLGLTIPEYTDLNGTFYPMSMSVLGWSCWFRNFVTSHEILHVIAHHHLYVMPEDSANHIIPNLFKETGDGNILNATTVEESILLNIAPMCQVSIFLNTFGYQADEVELNNIIDI